MTVRRPARGDWNLSVQEARALQTRLAQEVIRETTFDPAGIRRVAGVDVGFRGNQARAAIVTLSFPELEPLGSTIAKVPITFPYVPGLLAFREGPAIMAALETLDVWPDLFIFDAHGIAHPRRLGLASHIGVLLDWPSIGCAKSRLIGTHAEPGNEVGDWVPLYDEEEVIGGVVRSRRGVRPIYVSIGHRVDLNTAIGFVLRCKTRYRLPETTRYAHRLASQDIPPLAR